MQKQAEIGMHNCGSYFVLVPKHIEWCSDDSKEKQDGLALGIDDGFFIFRIISDEELIKELKINE